MKHVKETMKAHKGKPLSEILKLAKKTYKKTAKAVHRRGHRGGGEALYGFGAPTADYPGGGTLADGVMGASDVAKLAGNSYAPLGSMAGGMLVKAGRRRASRKSRKSRSRKH
jgi:hypothetical protein